MAAVTIHSDFRAQKEEICYSFHLFPFYFPWSNRTRCHELSFFNIEFLAGFFHSPSLRSSINYRHSVTQKISRIDLSCWNCIYPLNSYSLFPPSPNPCEPPLYSLASMNLTIVDFSCKKNHAILSFRDWLIPLSIMSSKFIHVVTDGRMFFSFESWIVVYFMYTYFLYIFICHYSFHILAVVNMEVQLSPQEPYRTSLTKWLHLPEKWERVLARMWRN